MIFIPAQGPASCRRDEPGGCGGARVLDLAICMILAVIVVSPLFLAL
ncbi:hypothetical protein [uncultured Methylobacterium sp.]